ncbi:hypothetical protein WJX72_000566 [[Myrmecia] bisecta]|uniref:RING-type domain-containing protein n=1 Tax=[Myrmecia] bisecta TaxID=41462 RepID=A0AAW1Q9C8_9CHLO
MALQNQDPADIHEVLLKALAAIARAKRLSQTYSSELGALHALRPANTVAELEEACAGSTTDVIPVGFATMVARAQRLAHLQRQQANTLQQLLRLRHEQLRLRKQQLSALQCLLRSEAELMLCSLSQIAAVRQAVSLLSDSLEDVDLAMDLLTTVRSMDTTGRNVCEVSDSVAQTDQRAEEVSGMARQLLLLLRDAPQGLELLLTPAVQTLLPDTAKGASEWQIAALPVTPCLEGSAMLGETCSICLAAFEPDDKLRCLQCTHYHHRACLDEWLRIRASCPLCKLSLTASVAPW